MIQSDIKTILRLRIKEAFDSCKPNTYPNFHRLIQTKEGYLKAETMIIDYVIKNTLPVSTAIAQLESELE